MSKLRVIIYVCSFIFFIFLLAFLTIAFTPLKKISPINSSSAEAKKEIILLNLKTLELEESIRKYSQYYDNISRIVQDSFDLHQDIQSGLNLSENERAVFPKSSQLEEKFRKDFEVLLQQDKDFDHGYHTYVLNRMHLPVEGKPVPVEGEDLQSKTIKIKAKSESGIFAVLDGVILAKYISGDKTHLYLLHENDVLSVYKFDGAAEVSQGEYVQKSQLIGTFSEKGEQILSFDLWVGTENIPPGQFLNF